METPVQAVSVQFLSLDLSEGREVWCGFNTEDRADDSYFFRFKSREGEITKLRVSKEAFAAMLLLRNDVDIFRDTKCVSRWVVKFDSDGTKIDAVTEPAADPSPPATV